MAAATTTPKTLLLPLFKSLKNKALPHEPFFLEGPLNANTYINASADLYQFTTPLLMPSTIILYLLTWSKIVRGVLHLLTLCMAGVGSQLLIVNACCICPERLYLLMLQLVCWKKPILSMVWIYIRRVILSCSGNIVVKQICFTTWTFM